MYKPRLEVDEIYTADAITNNTKIIQNNNRLLDNIITYILDFIKNNNNDVLPLQNEVQEIYFTDFVSEFNRIFNPTITLSIAGTKENERKRVERIINKDNVGYIIYS